MISIEAFRAGLLVRTLKELLRNPTGQASGSCHHRLMVRTSGSHPGNRGSIPRGGNLVSDFMYTIYWLFNDQETYVGFTDNLPRRLEEHRNKQVKTTKIFSQFRYFILEQAESLVEARQREKYWKSATGRKKLRKIYPSILARSSSG